MNFASSTTERMSAEHFQTLDIPKEAEEFLVALWEMIQGLDDWHDGTPADTFPAIWAACVRLPGNAFLAAHGPLLVPVMANMVMKWYAANEIESKREQDQLPKAYVWRAGYYDVVLQVVLIVHGLKAKGLAATVLRMYGETLEDYRKEFPDA